MSVYIGNHLSSSGGFLAMGKAAMALGADTFAFFTRNPRGGAAKEIVPEDAEALIKLMKENSFGVLVAHAPYTMNVCAAKEDIREFSRNMLKEDMARMEYLPGNYYNFHPGAHVGQGSDVAIPLIADAVNNALTEDVHTTILLETMAGKGSEVGRTFEEIRAIIDRVELKDKIGVCLDTCHIWDGGYDIVGNLDGVMREFDDVIGLDRLKAVHINDSKNEFNTHKDRHELIGKGFIGEDALKAVVRHPALQGKPFILETPNDDEGYALEIKTIRSWMV
ncbi:MAG: deoxyribonuclease IV [Lachnospiraceae bacterium]|nr:deoxyribonuclease IV [Lachnospiraceae bacterium]